MPKLFINSKSYFFIIFVALLLAIILKRITIGIDLADESYYASFLDDWLKDGLKNSANLMIHQTAELLLFPFAYTYQSVVGSETGLILFLRVIYTLLSFGAMLSLYFFIKPQQGQLIGAMVFAFGVLFIPWGLPAPSYNTLGMYGIVAAISLFAIAMLHAQEKKKLGAMPSFFSAFFWTLSIFAYPSLVIAFGGFIAIAYIFLKERRVLIPYLLLFSFFSLCSLIFLSLILGGEHLIEIFKFSNAMLHLSSVSTKFHNIMQVFQNPIFTILCLISLIMGGMVAVYSCLIFLAELFIAGALIYLTFFSQPTLFLASHDLIFIIALLGIFIPINALKPMADSSDCLVGIMYCSSFFAGMVTTITASNGLFNFPVGGLLAACLTLAFLHRNLEKRAYVFVLILSSICMGVISCNNFYGEMYGNPLGMPNQKINKGIFAGLITSKPQANFIYKMIALLPQERTGKKVLVFGRLSALYLLTSLSPAALSTWNYSDVQDSAVSRMISNFYQKKKNQPYLILDYRDPWGLPLAKTEKTLLKEYEMRGKYKAEIQSVAIYQKAGQFLASP
ncbi:MAG: hypothetical protein H0U73_13700 [Tatlockia sp.]|nr:hypothetical protein [Tatlockia sp.]